MSPQENSLSRYKFPRIPHLSWSKGYTGDDERLVDENAFIGKQIVVTEKMDGENTTIYSDGYIHARSIDGVGHPWQDWVKGKFKGLANMIPRGWRICGENMFAVHSIEYKELETYFYLFGVFNEKNIYQSWETVKDIASELRILTVHELLFDNWHEDLMIPFNTSMEGYVIRNFNSFPYEDFKNNIAKFVRANHVQTNEHWTRNWKQAKLKG